MTMLNNVSVLPVQTCGGALDVLGLPLPLTGRPAAGECTNAPVHDEDQVIITGSEVGR
ncbi:hypothetical protein [Allokutzneria albata]|uniref:hypothetical protein n=1 Tax=Allokutzneria albata TaxID=211114 RepID=UPI0018D3A0D2|nr:hypothetical protein [Allokutzneria albata]